MNKYKKKFLGRLKYRYNLWRPLGQAMDDYKMILDGEKIGVAVSGGKDSIVLLDLLWKLLKFAPIKFEIYCLTLNMGWQGFDPTPIERLCEERNIPFFYMETEIAKVLELKKEKDPCSLCSSMRRGALYELAEKVGCHKIALGHHLDDIITAFMLSLFFAGSLETSRPWVRSECGRFVIVRPLAYVREDVIVSYHKEMGLPLVESNCPYATSNYRSEMKKILAELEKLNPNVRSCILNALKKGGLLDPIERGKIDLGSEGSLKWV
ncbi:MAG: tRNA 2-thiocytidine(32) synthetase TtcA [Synergistetes bacterium]|nr:MAG: putative ATPase of the PP-loop superfamily implicated in cell cycle control [bacterium 42_11]MBC7331910.1 tRNA 2-thiocytidine(32) synthetase TtcA [Synergistota bacterium]MDK2871895.1 tRNA 2-thiocytidine biosynthesis protein TtcA [bacterium]